MIFLLLQLTICSPTSLEMCSLKLSSVCFAFGSYNGFFVALATVAGWGAKGIELTKHHDYLQSTTACLVDFCPQSLTNKCHTPNFSNKRQNPWEGSTTEWFTRVWNLVKQESSWPCITHSSFTSASPKLTPMVTVCALSSIGPCRWCPSVVKTIQ